MVGVGGFGDYRRERMRETGLFEIVAAFDLSREALIKCEMEDGAKPVNSFDELLETYTRLKPQMPPYERCVSRPASSGRLTPTMSHHTGTVSTYLAPRPTSTARNCFSTRVSRCGVR